MPLRSQSLSVTESGCKPRSIGFWVSYNLKAVQVIVTCSQDFEPLLQKVDPQLPGSRRSYRKKEDKDVALEISHGPCPWPPGSLLHLRDHMQEAAQSLRRLVNHFFAGSEFSRDTEPREIIEQNTQIDGQIDRFIIETGP